MSEYNSILNLAIKAVIRDYTNGRVKFFSEADLRCVLYSKCISIMQITGFEEPFEIYADKSVFKKAIKVDLVLGKEEVLVELKLEPDYTGVPKPVVFTTVSSAGASGSIEKGLSKIQDYAANGKWAHFIMIDEDGKHYKHPFLQDKEWEVIKLQDKVAYFLHVSYNPNNV